MPGQGDPDARMEASAHLVKTTLCNAVVSAPPLPRMRRLFTPLPRRFDIRPAFGRASDSDLEQVIDILKGADLEAGEHADRATPWRIVGAGDINVLQSTVGTRCPLIHSAVDWLFKIVTLHASLLSVVFQRLRVCIGAKVHLQPPRLAVACTLVSGPHVRPCVMVCNYACMPARHLSSLLTCVRNSWSATQHKCW